MKRLAAALLLAFTAACASHAPASDPNTAPPRGPAARIDERALMRMHPFAPVLAQLDDDIAALQATRRGGLSGAGAAIERSRSVLQQQLAHAAGRARGMNLAAPAGVRPAPASPRTIPVAQAAAHYAAALHERFGRAVALRAEQLREREATVDYQYDRAHAGQRLRLQLRLRSPYLDRRARESLRAALREIDAGERRAVALQRAKDAAELAQFRTTLIASDDAQLAGMQRDLAAHAAAAAHIPRPSSAIAARAEAIPARTDAAATAAAFTRASGDLTARFTQLDTANAGASAAVRDEVAALQTERDRLEREMRAQIDREADVAALRRGLGRVYTADSPSGAVDVTQDVAAALRAVRGST